MTATILPDCVFCLDEQRHPRWIPCGHSFCTECFDRYLRLSNDNRCPLCRQEFQQLLPGGISDDLQDDTLVLTLTEEDCRLFEQLYRDSQRGHPLTGTTTTTTAMTAFPHRRRPANRCRPFE